ncbi:5-methyltetrahydropteroyltriglutamate--homocysteine S-methyltransferase [Quadrisphaera sp. KR29]|uniref:5-methyltetrahydropteroyltriglutamate-- homocysteine S-methyltransferase n=1 Tax=Quadrisphaera sp. KR29 TaxID=3461391 RepID=UPI0040445C10
MTTPQTTPLPPFPAATVLGYPRVGPAREGKRALEAFWAGRADAATTAGELAGLRRRGRARLAALGLGEQAAVPSDASRYDAVLDLAVAVGAVPARFSHHVRRGGGLDLAGYSAVARGEGEHAPLEMTKWFDTNYHYLVPEIGPGTRFHLADDATGDGPVALFAEALSGQGLHTRPVLVGPVTFLLLSKGAAAGDPHPLTRLGDLLPVYAELLAALRRAGAAWVQLDEPALVADPAGTFAEVTTGQVLEAVRTAYTALGGAAAGEERPQLLVTTPYGGALEALEVLAQTAVEAVHLDLVRGPEPDALPAGLAGKALVAGVVDGHGIWRTDLRSALARLQRLRALAEGVGARVGVATSTSLLHVPHDVALETGPDGTPVPGCTLPPEVLGWLAFADQKVGEVVALADLLAGGAGDAGPTDRSEAAEGTLAASDAVQRSRRESAGVRVASVRERVAALRPSDAERGPYAEREAAQAAALDLPPLPTTTIGSFPQTREIRAARAAHTRGQLSTEEYEEAMRAEIADVVALQERLGLDVLVHGEAERNDMVQYFAEHLAGFGVTAHGWVQSYGSRCVRPPVLWGDVSRPAPITVRWAQHAQSLTPRPVKGMLTGPVTILAWSFVRDDEPLADVAAQVALALRDEVADLEAAGIGVIQVDEPALRELLPLRAADQPAYLDWSVRAFRLATSGVAPATQVHTHLCYSEFGEVIGAIERLDADVTSIEAARSRMEVLAAIAATGYPRGIGPGVYDIHSPRVPSQAEVTELLSAAVEVVDPRLLWVNPDCGLKTRGYAEVVPSLEHLVAAAGEVRASLAQRV